MFLYVKLLDEWFVATTKFAQCMQIYNKYIYCLKYYQSFVYRYIE